MLRFGFGLFACLNNRQYRYSGKLIIRQLFNREGQRQRDKGGMDSGRELLRKAEKLKDRAETAIIMREERERKKKKMGP